MIKSNIKAAILTNLGTELKIVDDLSVQTLSECQVLIKILYTGICKSQLMEIDGMRGDDKWIPHCLGHEAVGIVEQVGKHTSKVKLGDMVVVGWIKGDGGSSDSPDFFSKTLGKVNAGQCTTFSSHTVVSENRITKLPENFPINLGALFGCALPTGAGIILNEMSPNIDDTILLIGLGGVGMSALLALNALNIYNIICLDVDNDKLEMGKKFTGCITMNTSGLSKSQIKSSLLERYPEFAPFDYALDAAGRVETIELAFEAVKNTGTCFFASHPENGHKISIDPFDLLSGKKIFGSWGGGSQPDTIIPQLAKLFSSSHSQLEKIVTRYKGIENINNAIKDLRDGKIVRAILEV